MVKGCVSWPVHVSPQYSQTLTARNHLEEQAVGAVHSVHMVNMLKEEFCDNLAPFTCGGQVPANMWFYLT